jgi:hypothetical protein
MRVRLLVLAAGLLWPVSGFSQPVFLSGNMLYGDCTADQGSSDMAFCSGYVQGLSDALQSLKMMCAPKEVTAGQMRDVIVHHLSDHPEKRQFGAISEAGLALTNAFPCNKQPQ